MYSRWLHLISCDSAGCCESSHGLMRWSNQGISKDQISSKSNRTRKIRNQLKIMEVQLVNKSLAFSLFVTSVFIPIKSCHDHHMYPSLLVSRGILKKNNVLEAHWAYTFRGQAYGHMFNLAVEWVYTLEQAGYPIITIKRECFSLDRALTARSSSDVGPWCPGSKDKY